MNEIKAALIKIPGVQILDAKVNVIMSEGLKP